MRFILKALVILLLFSTNLAASNVDQMMSSIHAAVRVQEHHHMHGPHNQVVHVADLQNDRMIESYLLDSQGHQLYHFCYSSPQRLLDCIGYTNHHVQIALIYYDISRHWLPTLNQDLPESIKLELFQSRQHEHSFPRRASAKFVYYQWWRLARTLFDTMVHATSGEQQMAMIEGRQLSDLSVDVLSTAINMRHFWRQYGALHQHLYHIIPTIRRWERVNLDLYRLLQEAMSILSERQVEQQIHLAPIPERYNYVTFSDYLLRFLREHRPGWYDHVGHQHAQHILDHVDIAYTNLKIPVLLRQMRAPYAIDYRDTTTGTTMRFLNSWKEHDEEGLIDACNSHANAKQICIIVGTHLKPPVLDTMLQHDVEHIISPYNALIREVRLLEDTRCVREWNRRLQGFYNDLSHFFPKSQKNDELERWIHRTEDTLVLHTPLPDLYRYFHQRGKYIWIQLFHYIVNDLAYWFQEVHKLAHIIIHYQKKNKSRVGFTLDPKNCDEQHGSTLYSCIASIHHFVYQDAPGKMTTDKHYILHGNVDRLQLDLANLVGQGHVFTGLEAYRRTKVQPYKEILPARIDQGKKITSTWSPETSDEDDTTATDNRLKRSITTIKHPRQMYKAIGRALSER